MIFAEAEILYLLQAQLEDRAALAEAHEKVLTQELDASQAHVSLLLHQVRGFG